MEKFFYGVKLVVKTGTLADYPADAYISDDHSITETNVINVDICSGSSSIFENIFRKVLNALLSLDKREIYKTVTIEKFTKNTGNLNNYQIIRAILCGMYGFCQIANRASFLFTNNNNIRKITLVVPPENLSVVQELMASENFKEFTDVYGEKPSMQQILTREYCPRR